jgi:hypothetical protein
VSQVATHKQFCKSRLVFATAANIFATTVEKTGKTGKKTGRKAVCMTGLSDLLA